MESLLRGLFSEVPWLKALLAWCVALVAILLLLSMPAYFVLFPFARRVREELREYLERLRGRHGKARTARDDTLRKLADECRAQWSLRRLDTRSISLLERMLKPLLKSLKRFAKALNAIRRKFGGIQALERAVKLLESMVAPRKVMFPALPPAESLEAEVAVLRSARAKFVIASLLLIALIVVNTGMLSQILRDLGFIPPSLVFLGVPLYAVIAFILTILEAGIGFIHAAGRGEPGEAERFHVWSLVAIVLYVMIACVEGYFYSLVAPQRGALVQLPIGWQIKEGDLFFLWGFALITVLFALGSMWYAALDVMRRGNALTEIRRALRTLRKEQKAHLGMLEQAAGEIEKAKACAIEASRLLAGANEKAESARSAVEEVRRQIEEMSEQPPEWARVEERELIFADVLYLADQAGVWLILTLLGAFALVYAGFETIPSLVGALPAATCFVLGVAQVIVFFGSGLLFRSGELVVRSKGSQMVFVWAPIWSRALSCVLLAVTAAVYLYVVLSLEMATSQTLLWGLKLLIGLFLAASGYHVAPLLVLARVWLCRMANLVVATSERLELLMLRLIATLFTGLEYVFFFVAAPIFALRRQPLPVSTAERFSVASAEGGRHGRR